MKITFYCDSCATKLVVAAAFSGKKGRCHKCGQRMVIPTVSVEPIEVSSATTLAAGDWRAAVAGELAGAAGRKRAPTAGPDPDDEIERLFAAAPDIVVERGLMPAQIPRSGVGPSVAMHGYRSVFSVLTRATSWISEASYTVSFIVLILAIAAGMVGQHGLARAGLWAIVGFNLLGVLGDLGTLVMLSFRKNPLQGALFLLPPCALYYLWTDWQRYRETLRRMRIPVMMLGVVFAANLFIPWLSGGKEGPAGQAAGRVVDTLEGTVEQVGGAQAKGALGGLFQRLRALVAPSPASAPPSQASEPPSEETQP